MARSNPVAISCAVEGLVDEAVLRRLVQQAGATLGPVYGKNGKSHLRQRLGGYNRVAHFSPWVVLVDLDQDADCAPPLQVAWLSNPAPYMCFRVAVREVEAWLLADRERLAQFLGVAVSGILLNPEELDDPKSVVVELAKRSRRREIREDMSPRSGSGRSIGPAYATRLIEYAETRWRPEVAVRRSDSLRRCCERIREIVIGQA